MNIFNNKNFAGWASIASAVITISVITLSIYSVFTEELKGEKNFVLTATTMALSFIYLVIFIIIFINLKNLLNKDLGITSLDFLIKLVVGSNVTLTSFFIIIMPFQIAENTMPFQTIESTIAIICTVLLIPYGILHTIFGVKIFKLDNGIFGWRKSFSIFTILTGISLATIILLPLGLITSMISNILLAFVFFSAVKKNVKKG